MRQGLGKRDERHQIALRQLFFQRRRRLDRSGVRMGVIVL